MLITEERHVHTSVLHTNIPNSQTAAPDVLTPHLWSEFLFLRPFRSDGNNGGCCFALISLLNDFPQSREQKHKPRERQSRTSVKASDNREVRRGTSGGASQEPAGSDL